MELARRRHDAHAVAEFRQGQGYGSQPSGAGSDPAKWKPGATVQPVRVRGQEIAVLVGYTS